MQTVLFQDKADVYAKHRPSYPKALLDYLYTEAGFTQSSVIADIGSGTGLFAKELLARQNRVYGVEPEEGMRSIAQKELCSFSNFTSVAATAEHTTLPGNTFDFVTAAQAFHWFDRKLFSQECRRILKKEGKVLLVWNSRDMKSEIVLCLDALNRRLIPQYRGFSGGANIGSPDDFTDFFCSSTFEYREFPFNLHYDEDGFIGRCLSSSFAPKAGTEAYDAYVAELRALFLSHAIEGITAMPHLTQSYLGQV